VVFFCQNNQYAISEPTRRQSRVPIYQRAYGFGFPSVRVDGNDVLATLAVTRWALAQVRSGAGPVLVEALTYRMGAHTTADDPTRYRAADEVAEWARRDPLARLEIHLRQADLLDDDGAGELAAEADDIAADLRRRCVALPDPDPLAMFDHVQVADEDDVLTVQRSELAEALGGAPEPDDGDPTARPVPPAVFAPPTRPAAPGRRLGPPYTVREAL
jgi:pyruvate dehydrogenase E1 component alpha subunit